MSTLAISFYSLTSAIVEKIENNRSYNKLRGVYCYQDEQCSNISLLMP